MDKRIDLFKQLKNEGKLNTIYIYSAVEIVDDPYEKNTAKSFLNPLPIKAFISDLSFESLRWKYYGQMPMGSKQVICKKRYKSAFKIADKIKINDEYYKTYKDDDKGFAIIERENYITVVVQRQQHG